MSLIDYEVTTEHDVRQADQLWEPQSQYHHAPGDDREGAVIRVNTRELCRFTRQLATLLRAGMPLPSALAALIEQFRGNSADGRTNKITLSDIIFDVYKAVNEGSTFARALARYPEVFKPVFVNMIAAGESSGKLEDILLRLAQMQENRVRLVGKVKSVLAYPVMMIFVAVGVVVFLLSFVVPSVTKLFVEMNRDLPWPTRMLISTCAFLRTYWIAIPAMICLAFVGFAAWVRTDEGRLKWDRLKLNLPLVGSLLLKLEIARFARTLGTLLASGIPILKALDTVAAVIANTHIANALDSIKESITKGKSIAESVHQTEMFPPVVVHLMATGQDSGTIEQALTDIAQMYDEEVELTSKTLTSLLEPVILLVMGAIVGFIVLAILLPIFEINQAI